MSLPQSGITMSQVHCALGVFIPGTTGFTISSCTLSDLVKVNSINKWSRCKPIKDTRPSLSNTFNGLVSVMAAANYGLDIEADVCSDENSCLTKAATATTLWRYEKFTPSSTWPARLGDFRGYNHRAVCPFQKMVTTSSRGVEDSTIPPKYSITEEILTNKYAQSGDENYDENAEINPREMQLFSACDYYIIWRKIGTSRASSTTAFDTTSLTITTGEITGTTSNTGTFESCLALHKSGDSIWYPVPNTYTTFNVSNMTKIEYVGLAVSDLSSFVPTSNSKGELYVKFRVSNVSNHSITFKVGCTVNSSNISPQPSDNTLWSRTLSQETNTYTLNTGTSMVFYGTSGGTFSTTNPGTETMFVEGIGSDWITPFYSTCYARSETQPGAGVTISTEPKEIYISL